MQITFDCLYELPTFAFRDCMRGGPDAVVQPGEMMDSQDYYTVIFARGSMGLRLRTILILRSVSALEGKAGSQTGGNFDLEYKLHFTLSCIIYEAYLTVLFK